MARAGTALQASAGAVEPRARGRKRDFADAERLLRRYVAGELILSFVPNPEQRLWRTMTRSKHQLTRDRVRLHHQVESLLEDGRIKLGVCVSDLLGVSSRRILKALAAGETDAVKLSEMKRPGIARHIRRTAGCIERGAWSERHASGDSGVISCAPGID